LPAGVSAWISNWLSLPGRADTDVDPEEGFKWVCLWAGVARVRRDA
jgi:hypothetical protein